MFLLAAFLVVLHFTHIYRLPLILGIFHYIPNTPYYPMCTSHFLPDLLPCFHLHQVHITGITTAGRKRMGDFHDTVSLKRMVVLVFTFPSRRLSQGSSTSSMSSSSSCLTILRSGSKMGACSFPTAGPI